jgi:uncharacterized Fe-S cluster-containing radical SAM superfamily protein
METQIIVNPNRIEPQTYVIFDEDDNRIVAVIEVTQNENVTDRVALAIVEDGNYEKVTFASCDGEFDYNIKCDVIDEDEETFQKEYSLYLTAKY